MKYQRASILVENSGMQLTPLGRTLIARICECSAPEEISDADAIERIQTIHVSYGRSNYDDDVFLYTKSPFDDNWYYFANPFSGKPNLSGATPPDATTASLIERLEQMSSYVHLA